jgi:hypothetical protein
MIIKSIITVILLIFLVNIEISAQINIGHSNTGIATANHNQRKIVRNSTNNVFIVYADSIQNEYIIKGIKVDITDINSPVIGTTNQITEGKNPTLVINKKGIIHLLYESNDSITQIRHTFTKDFINWAPVKTISDKAYVCRLPVADSDSTNNINIFWIEKEGTQKESLIFARMDEDSLISKKVTITKSEINDISIANHLNNISEEIVFAIQFLKDSIQFFDCPWGKLECDYFDYPFFKTKGTQPCISINSLFGNYEEGWIRMLYLDSSLNLMEADAMSFPFWGEGWPMIKKIISSPVDYVCIDDLAPPIGFCFLSLKNGLLSQWFSYGNTWDYLEQSEISNGRVTNPSIAYKDFNSEFIDCIWMEGSSILYNRYAKVKSFGISDYEKDKGFSITGFPNPFWSELNIDVVVDDGITIPKLEIYNLSSQLIKVLQPSSTSHEYKYYYQWNARDVNNEPILPGVYYIRCTVGKTRTARKVIYIH